MKKTTLIQKMVLVFFGLILCCVMLELGLRIAGWMIVTVQEWRNVDSIRKHGEYRILCLGESTTADMPGSVSYPRHMETLLNEQNPGVSFGIINKGAVGATVGSIMCSVEDYVAQYHPHMIIAMMGINDSLEIEVPIVSGYGDAMSNVLRSLKIYKLINALRLHMAMRSAEAATTENDQRATESIEKGQRALELGELTEAEALFKEAIAFAPDVGNAYSLLGNMYRQQGRLPEAEDVLRKRFGVFPNDEWACNELANVLCEEQKYAEAAAIVSAGTAMNPRSFWLYITASRCEQGLERYDAAEAACKKAIEVDPANDEGYHELGRVYCLQGRDDEARLAFEKALAINPRNEWAYVDLGNFLCEGNNNLEAEKVLMEGLSVNPANECLLLTLAQCYRKLGRDAEAEAAMKKACALGTVSSGVYENLGILLEDKERYDEAIEVYKKAFSLDRSTVAACRLATLYYRQEKWDEVKNIAQEALKKGVLNDTLCGLVGRVYQLEGNEALANMYFARANDLRMGGASPVVKKAYRMLKDICEKNNITLVCMQYPVRSVEPLRQMVGDGDRVVFVSNESNFKNALKTGKYEAYFSDMFAGDFGHCTDLGNRLIAENVAGAVLNVCRDSGIIKERVAA